MKSFAFTGINGSFNKQRANSVYTEFWISFSQVVKSLLNHTVDKFNHDRKVNRTMRALSELDERTLRDIGVERRDIPFITEKSVKDSYWLN